MTEKDKEKEKIIKIDVKKTPSKTENQSALKVSCKCVKSISNRIKDHPSKTLSNEDSKACKDISKLDAELLEMLKKNDYTIVKYIDRGSTATVYKISNNKGETFAAKVINHSKVSQLILDIFLPQELHIVRNVQHPNIIQTFNVFQLKNYSVIVSEFASDGDLISYIEKISKPNISLSKKWTLQIVHGLVYLHSQGIAHRDIKADNVLLCQGVAKLSDFGYAQYSLDKKTGKVTLSTTFCGTLEYKAPETLLCNAPFDPFIADCFSLGVLIYTLVTLEFPFGSGPELRTNAGLMRLLKDIQKKRWHMNEEIKNDRRLLSLIKQLLNPDINERITINQTLVHPWLKDVPICNKSQLK